MAIEITDEMVEQANKAMDAGWAIHPEKVRKGLAAVLAIVERDYRSLLADLIDPDPCTFDHHGYCQAHGWLTDESRCPHLRAKELM